MLAFVDWLRASAADASISSSSSPGGPTAISLRDLLTWAGFVRTMAATAAGDGEQGGGGACRSMSCPFEIKSHKIPKKTTPITPTTPAGTMPPPEAFIHGAELVFLDGLGLGLGASPTTNAGVAAARARARARLLALLPEVSEGG